MKDQASSKTSEKCTDRHNLLNICYSACILCNNLTHKVLYKQIPFDILCPTMYQHDILSSYISLGELLQLNIFPLQKHSLPESIETWDTQRQSTRRQQWLTVTKNNIIVDCFINNQPCRRRHIGWQQSAAKESSAFPQHHTARRQLSSTSSSACDRWPSAIPPTDGFGCWWSRWCRSWSRQPLFQTIAAGMWPIRRWTRSQWQRRICTWLAGRQVLVAWLHSLKRTSHWSTVCWSNFLTFMVPFPLLGCIS